MRQQRSREFWEGLVREIGGGVSATEVARRHDVPLSTLHFWKFRIGKAPTRELPAMVPIVLKPDLVGPASEYERVVGSARVLFRVGTDVKYVAELANALGMQC